MIDDDGRGSDHVRSIVRYRAGAKRGRRPAIIVGDRDRRFQRLLISLIARTMDLAVEAAAGTGDLVSALSQCPAPVMLLVDIGGPDLDWVRRIKSGYPQVVLIGMSIDESASQALTAGCDDFLLKPFGLAEVQQKIEYWLGLPADARRRNAS